MANGSGVGVRTDNEKFAALDERVTNLRSSFQALEHSTTAGFGRLDAKLGEMSIAFQQGQQTPWSTIWTAVGVAFSILIGVGYLAYTPVQVNQTRLEASLTKLSEVVGAAIKEGPDTYIPRREADQARARAAEDRASAASAIADLRSDVSDLKQRLARAEMKERAP